MLIVIQGEGGVDKRVREGVSTLCGCEKYRLK